MLQTADAAEPSAMSESMLGAAWKSVLKPVMNVRRLAKRMGMQSSSCVSAAAIMPSWPESAAGCGQPNMGPIAT